MNKENELSDEQRARISQNFRAAKALLDRKRCRDTFSASDSFPQKNGTRQSGVGSVTRVPFSDISSNTSNVVAGSVNRVAFSDISSNTPFSVRNFKLNESASSTGKSHGGLYSGTKVLHNENGISHSSFQTPDKQLSYSGNSCLSKVSVSSIDFRYGVKSLDENEPSLDSFKTPTKPLDCSVSCAVEKKDFRDDFSGEMNMGAFMENDVGSSSFVTPIRQQSCSSFSEPLTVMPTIFYEEFDDAILAKIDEICESGIKSKMTVEESSRDVQLKIVHTKMNSSEFRSDLGPAVLDNIQIDNSMDGSSGNECGKQESGSSEDSEIGGMPDEYAKYMQSLNDRQREAACGDITMPLMIVAGPGSGKTSTMVGRVLMLLHKGIEASHILAMTFTTAAASEMRDRIGAVAGKAAAKELMISTFHSFSLLLCRLHAEKVGRTPDFLLYGQGQQRKAVIEAVRLTESGKKLPTSDSDKLSEVSNVSKNGPEDFREKSKKWLKFVAQAKASGKTSEDYQRLGN